MNQVHVYKVDRFQFQALFLAYFRTHEPAIWRREKRRLEKTEVGRLLLEASRRPQDLEPYTELRAPTPRPQEVTA